MSTDPIYLSAASAGRLMARRELSPVELIDAVLAQIERVDDRVKSYILVDAEGARASARKAEAEIMRGEIRGPLHGVPYGVKDTFYTRGLRTCANSRVLLENVPDFDAAVVERLSNAGAILMGKLNTWEFGTGGGLLRHDAAFDHARNPWRDNYFTGGSSTGSGAAVAAGTAMIAFGGDTGGSVRLPAAACGVQGLKTTYGLVSRHGVLPNCWSLDVVGPLAWTTEDCALALQATAGYDERDAACVAEPELDFLIDLDKGVRGMSIGVVRDLGEPSKIDAAVSAGIEDVIDVLQREGARIVEVALPMPPSTYRQVTALISGSERACVHEKDFIESAHLMGWELRTALMAGSAARAVDYVAAQRRRRELAASMDAIIRSVDAVLLPCALHTAPSFDCPEAVRAFMKETCTTAFSVTGHPALSFRTGFDESGLPTAAQLCGRYFDDGKLLRIARVYERAKEWHMRRPEL
jgi:aspartyl-tRNA(Asn)/glutamyl-tRNA(Gln) amidotransferase subunit A